MAPAVKEEVKVVKVVLETSVVVKEVVLVGMTTLLVEETSVVEAALVTVVVEDMVTVGMAIMGLVTMEAVTEVAEATMILAIMYNNQSSKSGP